MTVSNAATNILLLACFVLVAVSVPPACPSDEACSASASSIAEEAETTFEETMSTMLLHKQMTMRKRVMGPIDPEDVLGTCSGDGCPREYSVDRPCPSNCTAVPSGSEANTTKKKNKTAVASSSEANTIKKNNTIDPEDVLGTCSGDGCPREYSEDSPCPSNCTAVPSGSEANTTEKKNKTTVASSSEANTTKKNKTAVASSSEANTSEKKNKTAVASSSEANTTKKKDKKDTESSGSITYTYTTYNANSYMCASTMDLNTGTVTCAQGTYEAGTGENTTLSCTSGTINCFLFASGGKVGGSCSGDAFYEDASGWGYMANSTGENCLGQASCVLSIGDGTVNGVDVSPEAKAGNGKFNFKMLAMCA